MSLDDVRAVLAAAATIDPAADLALRLAAVVGARCAELAALRWKTTSLCTLALDVRTLELVDELRQEREPTSQGPRQPWQERATTRSA